MITVAVTGSVPTRDQHPGLPHTPAEIADATYDCYRAGAAIVHIHVRDPETGVPTYRLKLFRECVERIRDKCDILINLTTSGNNIPRKNVIEERLVLRCAPRAEVSCMIDGAECGRWSFRSECVPGAEQGNSGTVVG